MESLGSKRWPAVLTVAALCAFAWFLRWRGIEHSLPHATFRDGYYVFEQVRLMRTHDPEPQTHAFWGFYPHLVSRIVATLPDPESEPLPAGSTLSRDLERASATWLQIRLVSIAMSVFAIAATYGIARAFLSRGWSAFASLLVATSLLHVFFAQQEKCHGPASGTAALAVLATVHLRRRPTIWMSAVAGLAVALAIGTLQSGAATLIPLSVAAWLAMRKPGDQRPPWSRFAIGALIALALIVVAIRVLYPFHFAEQALPFEPGVTEEEGVVSLSGHGIDLSWFDGGGFKVVLDTLVSFEPVATALALVGLIALLTRRKQRRASIDRGDLWVVLAYVVPYLLAIGIYRMSFERFVIPLLPFLAVLAAFGARAIAHGIARLVAPSVRAKLVAAFAVLVLFPPTLLAWKLGSVRAADDTWTRAAAWMKDHVAAGREHTYALPFLDLPLFYSEDTVRKYTHNTHQMYWLAYQTLLSPEQRRGDKFDFTFPGNAKETKAAFGDDPIAYLEENEIDVVVIQAVAEKFRYDALPRMREALQKQAELALRISPLVYDEGGAAKLAIRYTTSAFERPFFVHLLDLSCEGPTLEIYRLHAREDAAAASKPDDDLQQRIDALEAIGYAGGTTAAPERVGVTLFDRARANAGLNLMVSGDASAAELVDMQGKVVHRWARTFRDVWPDRELPQARNDPTSWRRARIAANGELFAIFEGLGLVKLDKDSRVLWSFDGLAHHDLDVAPDGRIYVLTRKAHVDARFHADKPILEDFVTILDANGRELESISLLDCFENSPYLSKDAFHAGDVFHTNTLQLLDGRFAAQSPAFAAGNVLTSLRNTDQLAVVDLRAKTVVWERTGSWKQQHDSTLLDNGHVLVFDNKGRRERSSVLEIEPSTGEVAWSYAPKAKGDFYSASCGSAQRLANGNTLICSSEQGRAFEVTPSGEIVWEFWSPHRLPQDPSLVATLFDVVRLPADFDTSWIQ